MTAADERTGFEAFLRANGPFCLVARNGSRLCGSVMAGHDTRRGYVYHLAVDAGMQGHGVGTMLMAAVERALLEAGIEKVHLFIYVDNPARAFYEKTGWHLRRDIDVMSKVLRGDGMTGTREAGGG